MTVVHISGAPGSGKTTLGNQLKAMFSKGIVVFDTDEFIQHHNAAGRRLLRISHWPAARYNAVWRRLLKDAVDEFLDAHEGKIVVFVGMTDNFAANGEIYDMQADVRFVLDVPLWLILRRYYGRSCEAKGTMPWKAIAEGKRSIASSESLIKHQKRYQKWHKKHHYRPATAEVIIRRIRKLIHFDRAAKKRSSVAVSNSL